MPKVLVPGVGIEPTPAGLGNLPPIQRPGENYFTDCPVVDLTDPLGVTVTVPVTILSADALKAPAGTEI